MSPRHAAFAAAAAAALLCAGCGRPEPPRGWSALPDDAGIRMFAYVSEFVKVSPRDAGTPGAARASRWIAQELRRMGLRPEADCWIENTAHGRKAFCNVYVDFPGSSGQTVLLAGHYDTKSGIPGSSARTTAARRSACCSASRSTWPRRAPRCATRSGSRSSTARRRSAPTRTRTASTAPAGWPRSMRSAAARAPGRPSWRRSSST